MTITAGMLPGNLLPQADSDFETALSGNWSCTNGTLSQSSVQAFTGTHSLAVTASTTGTVTVAYTPKLTGNATTPVVFSGFVYSPQASISAAAGTQWFTSGGSSISTVYGTAQALTLNSFTPVNAALAAPATSATQSPSWKITGLSGGQIVYLDLLYVAPSLIQCLIAWPTPPLSLTPLFEDMTPYLRGDQSISMTRGRPDETSTVPAGSVTFTLDNQVIAGAFSQGNANSPWPIQLSRRVQINMADETGVFHTRFDGTITDIVPAWSGGPGLESTVQVTADGLIAWLSRNPGPTLSVLRSLIEEEALVDAPGSEYPLSEKAGAKSASDISGNSAPKLSLHDYSPLTTPTYAFGSPGIIGSDAAGFSTSILTCLQLTPDNLGRGYQLEGAIPTPVSAASGFSFEVFFSFAGPGSAACVPIAVAHVSKGGAIMPIISGVANQCFLAYLPSPTSTSLTLSSGFTLPSATFSQAVITVNGTTASLYMNGSATPIATVTVPSTFTANYLVVGGVPFGPDSNAAVAAAGCDCWDGKLSVASVYPGVLSTSRIAAHWTAAAYQNQGQNINTLIINTLNYAGIPSAFYSVPATGGVSWADAYDATGQNPLAMIQLYQQTDTGVFYEAASGKLTWQDRAARYAAQVTPALTLLSGQYEPDFTFPLTTQYLINDATYANNTIPNGVRAVNAASVVNNGTYANGTAAGSQFTNTAAPSTLTSTTAGSPLTGPWYSYPWQPLTSPSPDVLTDAVDWEVNIYGNPVPRSPSVTIDLASALGTGTQVARSGVYGCDIGSVIQLSGLPPASPAGTRVAYLMVEGIDETFTRDDSGITWTVTINTSPASQTAAWIAGDANLGVLDSTAVVGLGTDGANQAGFGEYVGPPYPVPTFSSTMNRTGSVGANDMRGLTWNTMLDIYPVMAVVQQATLAQSLNNASNTDIQWDTVWYDTGAQGGFSGWDLAGTVTTYTVPFPGVYRLFGVVSWTSNGTGERSCWFQQNGTQVNLAAITAAFSGGDTHTWATAQITCVTGDKLKMTGVQSSGAALALSTTDGGSMFAICFEGT